MKWLTKQPEVRPGELDWLAHLGFTSGQQGSSWVSPSITKKSKRMWLVTSFGLRRLYAATARASFHQEYLLRIEIMSDEIVDPFVRHALKELLDPMTHFSICKFDEICKLLNVIPPPGHRDRLSLMHCTKYRDMDLDLRSEVGRLIYESINTGGFDLEIQRDRLQGRDNVRQITGKKD